MCDNPHSYRISLQKLKSPDKSKCVSCFAILTELVPRSMDLRSIRILFANMAHQTKCKKRRDQRGYEKESSMKTRSLIEKGLFAVGVLALAGFAIVTPAARAA